MTPIEFHLKMIQLCSRWHASETSGYRTVHRNTKVKGHPQSYHMLWLARDVIFDVPDEENVKGFIHDAARLGIKALDERDHIHCQPM